MEESSRNRCRVALLDERAITAPESIMARILLVEDEVDVRLIMEHVLFDAGHKVDTTGTMTGACELIRSRSYDLVVQIRRKHPA
jgi:response regulator RpfG family c-di-GMP phosphodiesterase